MTCTDPRKGQLTYAIADVDNIADQDTEACIKYGQAQLRSCQAANATCVHTTNTMLTDYMWSYSRNPVSLFDQFTHRA